jgi:DNA polymerase-4
MRSVLFVDPPAFCTTLEGLVSPALSSRPLAVAPPAADRATLLALSDEARRAGLVRGMPVRKAQRLCPDLIVLPPNPQLYARASRALHEILRVFAPTIEPRGYGHAFLDLTGTGRLFGPAQDVAARIRREAKERLKLPISVGIASNKLVSQAAIKAGRQVLSGVNGSAAEEHSSDESLLYVPGGSERSFLAPQPLDVLPELDPIMRARLDDYQLDVIGDVAAIPDDALCAVFGGDGRLLGARARGIDPRPVLPPERRSEFHIAHTLATDTNDWGVLHPILRLMSQRLGHRLRRRGLTARRLRLEATYADYTTTVRAIPLAAVLDVELWEAAQRAFSLALTKRLAIRSVALTLDRLAEAEAQLELWMDGRTDGLTYRRTESESSTDSLATDTPAHCPPVHPSARPAALQHAVDRIHTRYGAAALTRGRSPTPHDSALHSQTTTIFPNVAFPSSTRWASAS